MPSTRSQVRRPVRGSCHGPPRRCHGWPGGARPADQGGQQQVGRVHRNGVSCYVGTEDTLALLAALELARPGDVVVAATEEFKGSAVVGDLFAAMARTQRVTAIVTDGLARDSEGIAATGLPVFASGISPSSAARSGPGTVGLPIDIGGVRISPGDVLVGDQDGVAVVGRDDLDAVHQQLEAVRAAESSYPTGPGGEVQVPQFVRTLLESAQVRYVD
ncbi:MAG: RraA family protein [Streptosporangiaceae bacterium]|nr:RraA family protein [Streptosporangiaceae bacterium]MBV9853197.1 RraA family protein [Streptosporangiaceae bacterium]